MTAFVGARPLASTRPLLLAFWMTVVAAWAALVWLIAAPAGMAPATVPAIGTLLSYESPAMSLSIIVGALGALSACLLYVRYHIGWLGDTTEGDDYRSNPSLFINSYTAFGIATTGILVMVALDSATAVALG